MTDTISNLLVKIEALREPLRCVDLRINGVDLDAAVGEVRSLVDDLCDLVREQERTIERLQEELDEVSP
jgi:uncharacterized coiled-coil protein SlyX